ncbi:transglutaminase domain-containing protein [Rhodopirellula maiorica SM1]|uniref:Transglutaminase domain-containing protein n=1 Tax=Rhodopirellula maiorica SM1 TaxID=1265738 RepID=M5RPA4_9BACT|nr:transglutaminase family protein [Rhodopirellula maiorica]EMI17217.1 transglutaminase domain-containing protein [Rhodopirellula maiorica SM1]
MTIRVALHHQTRYLYSRAIHLGPQLVRLRPAYHGRTKIDAYNLKVEPKDHFVNWQQDPFANPIARFVFQKPTKELCVTVDLTADMTVINPFDFFVESYADNWPFDYDADVKQQLAPYLTKPVASKNFDEWMASLPKSTTSINDFLVEINRLTQQRVKYLVRMEPGVQTPEQTLDLGSGSCRDSAWLLVETFRQLGLAARFVSGYLIQLLADEKPLEGPAGPVADFCDLHAWTEVFLPGAGWVGLDPTSGLFAGEGHIPLACTPSYTGAAPITGGHEACEVEFEHTMTVSRIYEDPRVTKPYSDKQWSEILRSGRQIDERLRKNDVRLTMGGEPTFVSIDNMEDPQWNTDAVGEEKRVLSNVLLLRLRDKFAPGGLLHYGQGKWYPGESLPRWALTCMWRRDGQPVWNDPKYIADEGKDYGLTADDANRFVQNLASELGINAKMSFPVYEDVFHYLWRENRLPVDVDPTDPKLDDPNERAMMMRTFTQGLSKPVGCVLPLRRAWWQAKPGWISGRWPVRAEKLYLIPGDSPIGLRLPLESLPSGTGSNAVFYTTPADPFATHPPLPPLGKGNESVLRGGEELATLPVNEQTLDEEDPDDLPTSNDVISTALCVECRFGRLHVFMPPTQRLEDYLDLVSAIEQTCAKLDVPVILEGYLPPPDDRIEYFKVTPDPGVIEINTQPTDSWDSLVNLTETLYEEAKQSRLGAEKFDLDGRHTGTGGGSHIVLGGSTPSESPFIRRPDLLASMIRFWNNHPALSYLFSSRFIGPTSQAPRMDEARVDAVYEMEIALSQLNTLGENQPPWLVDRLFRDLLVDLTGNTHRTEICIDKLYSPDSSTGRLGLVELRGFEMPPNPRMNLAQQLLIRSAIAVFWEKPYQEPMSRWQTTLYDRFMLPHFIWQDLCDLIDDLNRRGATLRSEWFAPQHEFRFPKIGEVTHQDVQLRLRSGIEPWYVMGEEPGSGGTARYVDSSLERLEILVDGMDSARYAVLCNGVRVPMHPTGVQNQYVAGVKYRAWQPPRCLHPTIGIHTPLQFDIVDLRNRQSIGGCRYHAVHPAGRSHEKFPINASEAESRRVAQFERSTLSGEKFDIADLPPLANRCEYPITLDLRRHVRT